MNNCNRIVIYTPYIFTYIKINILFVTKIYKNTQNATILIALTIFFYIKNHDKI